MYNKILAPLDGSKRAEKILFHVEELARRCDAEVIFLQVIEPPPFIAGPGGSSVDIQLHHRQLEERIEEAESYLAALQGEFREKGVKGRTIVNDGPAVEAIISVAEREGADLIALASHGRTGLSQVFYGSVAAGVLHRVNRPLLLVRSQDHT